MINKERETGRVVEAYDNKMNAEPQSSPGNHPAVQWSFNQLLQ